jgi:hypothetical protein
MTDYIKRDLEYTNALRGLLFPPPIIVPINRPNLPTTIINTTNESNMNTTNTTFNTSISSLFNCSTKLSIDYGYRQLEVGETIMDGDEYTNDGIHWYPVSVYRIGRTVRRQTLDVSDKNTDWPMRRKEDVGEGYRLIERGEKLREGDEIRYGSSDTSWRVYEYYGYCEDYKVCLGITLMRRKLVSAAEQAYIDSSSKLKVGTGYRIVKWDEQILDGDEVYTTDKPVNTWYPSQWKAEWGFITVATAFQKFATGKAFVAIRRPLPNIVELLREEIANLKAAATASSNVHAAELADAQAETEAAEKLAEDLKEQVDVMVKNASGTAVLVNRDGFSKPFNPGSAPWFGFRWLEPVNSLCSYGYKQYEYRAKKDGFGRYIFEEVS